MPGRLNICVLGAGSWGTTLAVLLDENEHKVALWEFFADQAKALVADRENKKFLPGVRIPDSIAIETDMAKALDGADLVLFVVPSHVTRDTARSAAKSGLAGKTTIVVNAAKGLEEKTLERMSEVLVDELPVDASQIATLSGPSHAEEVSRQMPTSVVAAGIDAETITRVQDAFFRPYFRVYTNTDLVGVEIGVALKNIIAIAAGVCDGLGYGDNTKAALLTRGLVEITRLGCALGARQETFFGLAGIGDLIATALSQHSRNRHVGERIGKGETIEEVLGRMVMVAEGVRTTRAAVDMGRKMNVELPIIESVHAVLFESADPKEAISLLMNRPPQQETSWMREHDSKGGKLS
jgi:glycerol-3-phosphate dehydrogenase (NAD(P)+)